MDRAQLRGALAEYYDGSELRDLCFDLDVDYDALPGESKTDKARALVQYCERHSRLYALAQAVYEARPFLGWSDLMHDAIKNDAYREHSRPAFDERPTQPFAPMQPIPSRTGPLRQDLHNAVMGGIERLSERVETLSGMINELIGKASQNRALIVVIYLLYVLILLAMGGLFLMVTRLG